MRIRGLGSLTPAEVTRQLAAGGRFVLYEYCVSLGVVTCRRPSAVYFLPAQSFGLLRGLPYTLLSLLLGWWGIPWGLIYTPLAVATNLAGGRDVTATVRALLLQDPRGQALR
jgi:hypothetical protein